MNGYGGAVDFLHDVDMENLYFGNGDDDDDFFDPDFDDQLDFLVRVALTFGYIVTLLGKSSLLIAKRMIKII